MHLGCKGKRDKVDKTSRAKQVTCLLLQTSSNSSYYCTVTLVWLNISSCTLERFYTGLHETIQLVFNISDIFPQQCWMTNYPNSPQLETMMVLSVHEPSGGRFRLGRAAHSSALSWTIWHTWGSAGHELADAGRLWPGRLRQLRCV